MPTINKLPLLDTISGGDQLPVYSPNLGDARRMSVGTLAEYIEDNVVVPNNAANVTYDPAGTGAVSRSVQAKLRDVVSVKDFGAVGDGVTNDTAAIQAAVNYASSVNAFVFLPAGTYVCGAFTTSGSLRMFGTGVISQTGTITLADTASELVLSGVGFTKGNNIGILQASTGTLQWAHVTNITIDGGFGLHLRGAVKEGYFSGNRFENLYATSSSCAAIQIGTGSTAASSNTKRICIDGNVVSGVGNSTADETHAFIVNGCEIVISNNIIDNVYHSTENACEAVYVKGVNVAITGNIVKNSGPSEDGCIAAKRPTHEADAGKYNCAISGNTVSYDLNQTKSVRGITSTIERANISGNALLNTYLRGMAAGQIIQANKVHVTADAYAGLVFYAEDAGANITVVDNDFTLISKNLNSNTLYAAYVRGTAFSAISGFNFSGNRCLVEYQGMTTGGSTAATFLNLWADAGNVEATVANNTITVSAPAVTTFRNILPLYGSGANAVTLNAKNNTFYYNNAYAPAFRVFEPANSGAKTLRFEGNSSPVNQLTTANLDLILGYDSIVSNINATGVYRVNLQPPVVGRNVQVIAANRTHAITVRPNGTWSDGTTTDKTLASGGTVNLSCFETGYWHVVSVAGSFT